MKDLFDNPFIHLFHEIALTKEDIAQLEEYHEQYANKSENYILRKIIETKNILSKEVLQQHQKNLSLLAQMEGFLSEEQKKKIQYLIHLLESDIAVRRRRGTNISDVEEQSFKGRSSLLLWFLLLSIIWRRPSFRYPFY